jgi:hypothetical protein
MERLIGERLGRIREGRAAGSPRKTRSAGPHVDHMRVARDVTKAREASKRSGGAGPGGA